MTARIVVLASGRGSNLQALHAYLERVGGAEIVRVISDRAESGALGWARDRQIATSTLHSGGSDANALLDILGVARADLVVLAGYLRLVPSEVVRAYRGRILNVHPALLPAFGGPGMYGARVHQAVLTQARPQRTDGAFGDEHTITARSSRSGLCRYSPTIPRRRSRRACWRGALLCRA